MTKCAGCGLTLQLSNPKKSGFLPKRDSIYCQRCFRIIHYNDAKVAPIPKEINEIIKIVEDKGHHVVFVIDFFNISKETLDLYNSIKNKKILVISKLDLVPRSFNLNKIKEYLINEYELNSPIFFISSLKKLNIRKLHDYLTENNINQTYFLGVVNSGKSSLVNSLYEMVSDTNSLITTSLIPNTTLDFINLKIDENLTLIDSPGFVLENDLLSDLEIIKKTNPTKYIKPLTYQLKKNSGISIEDKVKICHLSDIKNSFTFYMSNLLSLKKIYNVEDKIKMVVPANSDIIIKGLGFINVKKKCDLLIWGIDESMIELRPSIF